MAKKAADAGVKKTKIGFTRLFCLSLLAGAFIALGAIFATIVLTGVSVTQVPWGWSRFLAGAVFSLGLILVVVGGAELFTGNNLMVMAWVNKQISSKQILYNWLVVFIGNFIGAVCTAFFVFLGKMYLFDNGVVGSTALNIAQTKVNLGFVQAIFLGILCNALVCLAVWLTYSARSTIDKIASIILPIAAFVAAGFEHCVANMFFIPFALFVKSGAPESFWQTIGKTPADFAGLTWGSFLLNNLLPVTIGNIIGGAVLVGALYWIIYLKK